MGWETDVATMMYHNTRELCVNGKKLEVAWHGPPPDQAPTLIFLHEGLGCVSLWHNFPQKVADAAGCGALVYSRIGYGKSAPCELPRPIRFMHDEGLDILPQLIEAAELQDFILIGHSDGASIALIYAGGTPAIGLRGVITEAPHVFCEKDAVGSIAAIEKSYRQGDLRERLAKHHGATLTVRFGGGQIPGGIPTFYSGISKSIYPRFRFPCSLSRVRRMNTER